MNRKPFQDQETKVEVVLIVWHLNSMLSRIRLNLVANLLLRQTTLICNNNECWSYVDLYAIVFNWASKSKVKENDITRVTNERY